MEVTNDSYFHGHQCKINCNYKLCKKKKMVGECLPTVLMTLKKMGNLVLGLSTDLKEKNFLIFSNGKSSGP